MCFKNHKPKTINHKLFLQLSDLKNFKPQTPNSKLLPPPDPHRAVFIEAAGEADLVSFLSVEDQHQGGVGRDGAKVVGKHGQGIEFLCGVQAVWESRMPSQDRNEQERMAFT